MTESKQELLRGTLDMLVLKVVALGPSHGYAIAQRLQQISKEFFQVHQGSLYPALHRLEDKGWLQAEWKESETGLCLAKRSYTFEINDLAYSLIRSFPLEFLP
jgi:PadR family transcriptional regulator PadR